MPEIEIISFAVYIYILVFTSDLKSKISFDFKWLINFSHMYLENYTLIRRHQILIECFKTNSISLTKQKPEPGQRDATCCG